MKRKQAAIQLNELYNSLEVKSNKISTTYQKMWFDGWNWRLRGYAHDYIV